MKSFIDEKLSTFDNMMVKVTGHIFKLIKNRFLQMTLNPSKPEDKDAVKIFLSEEKQMKTQENEHISKVTLLEKANSSH